MDGEGPTGCKKPCKPALVRFFPLSRSSHLSQRRSLCSIPRSRLVNGRQRSLAARTPRPGRLSAAAPGESRKRMARERLRKSRTFVGPRQRDHKARNLLAPCTAGQPIKREDRTETTEKESLKGDIWLLCDFEPLCAKDVKRHCVDLG